MNAMMNQQPHGPVKGPGDEMINEIRQGVKFRPVLHALTANPGAELMRYAAGRENMITLGQGEGDSPTPDFIARAAFSALQDGKTYYGPTLGQMPLRQALEHYYKRIYNLEIPAERIWITASGSTAMHLSLAALLDKGDEVVAVTPIWKNLIGAIELTQATTCQVALDYSPDKGWSLDLEKLFAACTERTKVMLIVTPSNPTGWSANHQEMKAILEFARTRGIWIFADEVYGRLVYESQHEHLRADSFLDVAQPDDLLLVVNSFSKSWAMTGWRLGWIVGPEIAESKIRDVALYNNLCPPTFTQYGAIAALERGEPFLKEQIDLWRGNRDLLVQRMAAMPRVSLAYPAATFYSFFKVEAEPDCIALTKKLIDEAQLLLSPGVGFGEAGRGYIRLCFAVSRRRLSEALDRLESVINK
jgi:aspartate aminotransferase